MKAEAPRARRRPSKLTGRERAVIGMLLGLIQRIESGGASANVRVELEPRREVWLMAASVQR